MTIFKKIEKLSLALLKSHGQSERANPDKVELCPTLQLAPPPDFWPRRYNRPPPTNFQALQHPCNLSNTQYNNCFEWFTYLITF